MPFTWTERSRTTISTTSPGASRKAPPASWPIRRPSKRSSVTKTLFSIIPFTTSCAVHAARSPKRAGSNSWVIFGKAWACASSAMLIPRNGGRRQRGRRRTPPQRIRDRHRRLRAQCLLRQRGELRVLNLPGGGINTLQSFRASLGSNQPLAAKRRAVDGRTVAPARSGRARLPPSRIIPEARGLGAKVFVPWSLYATVAEWNFLPDSGLSHANS